MGPRLAADLAQGLERGRMLARFELHPGQIQAGFVVAGELGESTPEQLHPGPAIGRRQGLGMGPPRLEGHRGSKGHEHLARAGRRGGRGEGDVAGHAGHDALKGVHGASGHERRGESAPRNVEQADLQDHARVALHRARHEPPGAHGLRHADGGGSAEAHRGQAETLLHAKPVVSLEDRHPQLGQGPRQLVGHGLRDPGVLGRSQEVGRRHHHGSGCEVRSGQQPAERHAHAGSSIRAGGRAQA